MAPNLVSFISFGCSLKNIPIPLAKSYLKYFINYHNGSQFKRAPNNDIDPDGPGPLDLIFANQLKRLTRVKLRVFILKVASSGLHVTFLRT